MDDKKCRCGTGNYCHEHKAYNLPPAKREKEARRVALLGMGKDRYSRPTIKNKTEVG